MRHLHITQRIGKAGGVNEMATCRLCAEMIVSGIMCRTQNSPDAAPRDIPRLYQRFHEEKIRETMPFRSSDELMVVYYDYEKDATRPYSCLIGCQGASSEKTTTVRIPVGRYAMFRADSIEHLIATWGEIWNTSLPRTYIVDYEVHCEDGSIDIFVGVSMETKEGRRS